MAGSHRFIRRPGDEVFSVVLLLFSLFLFSQMWSQTVWQPGRGFAAQPGFWPRAAILVMVVGAATNLVASILDARRRMWHRTVGSELRRWTGSLEFAGWFMAYVFLTPALGYLPCTLLFMMLLVARVNHRSGRALMAALLVGLCIVLLFKSYLRVNIPGGALYDLFPASVRVFFVQYL